MRGPYEQCICMLQPLAAAAKRWESYRWASARMCARLPARAGIYLGDGDPAADARVPKAHCEIERKVRHGTQATRLEGLVTCRLRLPRGVDGLPHLACNTRDAAVHTRGLGCACSSDPA